MANLNLGGLNLGHLRYHVLITGYRHTIQHRVLLVLHVRRRQFNPWLGKVKRFFFFTRALHLVNNSQGSTITVLSLIIIHMISSCLVHVMQSTDRSSLFFRLLCWAGLFAVKVVWFPALLGDKPLT